MTLSGRSVHCSRAPLQGRGQWWNTLQFHEWKMNDFVIHLYSLEICVTPLISFVGFLNEYFLPWVAGSSLKLSISRSFSCRGRNMMKSED